MLTLSGDDDHFITCPNGDTNTDVDLESLTVLPSGVSLSEKFSDLTSGDKSQDSLSSQKRFSLSLDCLRQSSVTCCEVPLHWEHVSRLCCDFIPKYVGQTSETGSPNVFFKIQLQFVSVILWRQCF